MRLKSLSILFILLSSVFAASVSGNFRDNYDPSGGTYRFNTDMSFSTDFTVSLVSGSLAKGSDPTNIQSGDAICSGSVIKVTPKVTAKWAVSTLDVGAWYPNCGAQCPLDMVGDGSVSNNQNIQWIGGGLFDSTKLTGDSNPYSHDRTTYNNLGTFVTESMAYTNDSGTYNGKEGGANVFCKGNLYVKDLGSTVGSPEALPNPGPVQDTPSGTGSHTISTSIGDAACIAMAVKHPLETGSTTPDFFLLSYYTLNQPSVPDASSSKTIDVQSSGGSCSMGTGSVTGSASLSDTSQVMVKTVIDNTGSYPINVTGVTSSNGGYTVIPFPVSLCSSLGFPSSFCPPNNNFNTPISAGGNLPVYVLVTRQGGASGGTTLTYDGTSSTAVCGGSSTCSTNADLTGAVFCTITPSSLTIGSNEWATFGVQCDDLADNPVSCVGDNWYLTNLNGGFISKSNSQAQVYFTSPPGSSGTLDYKSGLALCSSDINVNTPLYECEFIPPSATMNVSTSKYFQLNCFVGGNPKTPDGASYYPINGLDGTTGNSSTAGTAFTSSSNPSIGQLLGVASYNSAPQPIGGAIALADIIVQNGNSSTSTGNNTNGTNPGGGPGATDYCTIGNGPFEPFQGFYGWLGIKCGKDANETCDSVSWSITPGTGSLPSSNTNGTWVDITGGNGLMGEIDAIVDSQGHGCSKPFTISEPLCWEVS